MRQLIKNREKGFTPLEVLKESLEAEKSSQKSLTGFTLVELLVVIAIIGLLASIVMVSVNAARLKARKAKAVGDIRSLSLALEMYYDSNGSYPSSQGGAGPWDGYYTCWGDSTPNWIPGLVPTYISVLPREPRNTTDCSSQYIYNSNGTDYKLIYHSPEDCAGVVAQYPSLADPARVCWAYGIYTPGGVAF